VGVFPELGATELGKAYRKAAATGQVVQVEDYYRATDRWIRSNVYPSAKGLSIFAQDVTEKRKQQAQLVVTEKLAATGRLAATIAHEINNPLESVLNLLYLARISPAATEEQREYLLTAEKELTRVSNIARHTLGFYRDTSVPVDTDIAKLLDEVLVVYQSRLQASGICLTREYADVPPLHALRGELHQVFSNLVSNAIDAMRGGGELRLQVQPRVRDRQPGIEVRVQDTGPGIPAENRAQLFEPFFTTKTSVGTGLGLWVVKQFVDNHGGTVTVQSSTGAQDHGTCFAVFIPLSAAPRVRTLAGPLKMQPVM
jgi:signal transduction histidine kinase